LRYLIVLVLLLVAATALPAQDRSNPFEITSRLPAQQSSTAAAAGRVYSPFDIRPAGASTAVSTSIAPARSAGSVTTDSAPTAGTGNIASASQSRGPIVIQSTDPDAGKGSLLIIHLFLLLAMASLWLLFGDMLRQCLRSTVNDGVMNQLYTHRSGNQLSALWLFYCFFYLAAGFYIYLFATSHDVSLNQGIFPSWLSYSLLVAAAVGLKHWVLWAYARLFPVRKEVSRYAFVLMVFSILAGIFIVPVNLLVSYAPESWRYFFLYSGLFIFAGVYLLHSVRGLFIAGRLAIQRPVHFLLYICALEFAPLLLIYRYLSDTLV